MISEKFVLLAALINFIGGLSYLFDTLKGKVVPNRVTWILWATAPGLAFAAQIKSGVGLPALFTFTTFFMPFLITVASFIKRKAIWQLTRTDYVCGMLSVAGLVLWLVTGKGVIAITAGILSDAFAAIPTLIKSYRNPETENWKGFATGATGAFITLLTIDSYNFENSAFALYILCICLLLVFLIALRPKFMSKHMTP